MCTLLKFVSLEECRQAEAMFGDILPNYQVLMLNVKAPPTLSALEIQNIKTLMSILKPLEYVTKELSGERYVTISKIIPIVNCLKAQINDVYVPVGEDYDDMTVLHAVKKEMIKQIERRFGCIEENYLISISCLLDPRFKNIPFKDKLACAKSIKLLRQYITSSSSVHSSENESDSSIESAYDFWSHYKKLAHTEKLHKKSCSAMNVTNNDELSRYLSAQVSPLSIDPLKQWDDMKVVYPKLYNMAKKYLGIPATSVPSERLFSKAGSTVTKTRNRLSPKRLDKLLFLGDCTEEEWDI